MKKFMTLLLIAYILVVSTACSNNGANEVQTTTTQATTESLAATTNAVAEESSKILVAYFSYGENADLPDGVEASTSASINPSEVGVIGNTSIIANMIAENIGADVHSIKVAELYPGDYDTTVDQAKDEQNNDFRPTLTSSIDNLDDYDTVFIGYPIWWGDAPKIVYTFMESYDFSDKTIVPFCTSGGSGISTSEASLSAIAGGNWLDGERFNSNVSDEDINSWLSELGLK